MSDFDDFFKKNKKHALVSEFVERPRISLGRKPLHMFLSGVRKSIFKYALFKLVTSHIFTSAENIFNRRPILSLPPSFDLSGISPPYPHSNLHSADRTSVNYRKGNEPELAHLIDRFMPIDGVFFDCGGHWGEFSFYVLSNPDFSGRIHCFEPLPLNFKTINYLKSKLDKHNRLTLHEVAVSDAKGESEFYVPFNDTRSASLKKRNKEAQILTVSTTTIDELNLGPVNFLKLDVEGRESKTLSGMRNTIKKYKPYIFMESNKEFNELVNFIQGAKELFSCSKLDEAEALLEGLDPDCQNYVSYWIVFSGIYREKRYLDKLKLAYSELSEKDDEPDLSQIRKITLDMLKAILVPNKIDDPDKIFQLFKSTLEHADLRTQTTNEIDESNEAFKILEALGYLFYLPAWVQNKDTFFVGIGENFQTDYIALVPFEGEERNIFTIDILNIFAVHRSQTENLGLSFYNFFNDKNYS